MGTINKLKIFMIAFIAIVSVSVASAQCTASFNAVDNGNGNYTFNSTSTGSNYSYWNFGDGNGDNTNNTTVSTIYLASGTYTVSLIVGDSNTSCIDTAYQTLTVTSSPCNLNASFTYIDNGNGNYTFTSSVNGGVAPYSYSWIFDGGGTSTLQNPTYTFPNNSVGGVYLSVTDANGCSAVETDTVTGSISPACNVVVGFTYIDNGNGNYTFTSSVSGGVAPYTYLWGFAGSGTSALANPIYTFPNNSFGGVYLTVTDANGCSVVETDTLTGSISPACNLVAGFTYVDNGNGNYTFTSTSTGNNFGYWDFGDGSYDNVNANTNHTYLTNGTYTVSYLVGDSNGTCLDTVYQTIIVGSVSLCNQTFIAYDSLGYTYFETVGGNGWSNGSTYFWDFGDGTTYFSSVWSGISHQYLVAGTYYYCITVDSCPPVCDSIVVSYNSPCNVYAGFTTADNGNGNYSFTDYTSGTTTSLLWNFGDGTTSTSANPNHTFLANGVYAVVLYVEYADSNNNVFCSDYQTVTINVTGVINPVACNAAFVTYTDSSLFNGVIVINNSTGNNLTYFWDFGDGNTSTQQYPTYVYTTAGPFNLCLTVSDANGMCSSTYCDSIGSNGIVFKGGGFTINVQAPVATGIETQIELVSDINLYPNPVKNNLTISLNLTETSNVELFVTDMLGNTVAVIANQEMYSGNNQLNWKTNNAPNGIYLLNIRTENSLEVKKLIVNK